MKKRQTSVVVVGAAALVVFLVARAFTASATPGGARHRAVDPGPSRIGPEATRPVTNVASNDPVGEEADDVKACDHGEDMDRLAVGDRRTGPVSVSVDLRGRRHVLDPEHGRLVRYDAEGHVLATIPMASSGADHLAVAADGSMAVLDRFGDESVELYDENGNATGSLPLAGEGIDDVSEVTGVFVDGRDVYVQREWGSLVLLGDTSGVAATARTELPGKPGQDGSSLLTGAITDEETGRAFVASVDRASGDHRFSRELNLMAPIASMALLDADKTGKIYVAFEVAPSPDEAGIVMLCLDPLNGATIGTATLPNLPDDASRVLAVSAAGGVLATVQTSAGTAFEHYDCH